MPVALGADSPLPYSSRPFGVASVVLAPPVLSTPVELEAGMSTAGSRAPVSCSTVVGSAQATSGVGGSTPVPASFLAPAAIVAPPPVPVVAPSHVPPPGVLHSPAAEQADAVMMASASGEAPPPAPVQVPSPVAALAVSEARAAVSPGVPDGTSAPPSANLSLLIAVPPGLIRPHDEMSGRCLGAGMIPLAGSSRKRTGMRIGAAGGEVAVAGVAGGRMRRQQLLTCSRLCPLRFVTVMRARRVRATRGVQLRHQQLPFPQLSRRLHRWRRCLFRHPRPQLLVHGSATGADAGALISFTCSCGVPA
ncbi:unnamed protein product [Closterium sp. NIES-54]